MTQESVDFIQEWREVPDVISAAIANLSDRDLALQTGNEGWTIRETVHHSVWNWPRPVVRAAGLTERCDNHGGRD